MINRIWRKNQKVFIIFEIFNRKINELKKLYKKNLNNNLSTKWDNNFRFI